MKTLVTGWFSFERLGATAGDLVVRDVVCGWLDQAGVAYDVANAQPFEGGVDWRRADPDAYDRLVFVCGPFYVRRRIVRRLPLALARAAVAAQPILRRVGLDPFRRFALELLVRRFPRSRLVGVDLSVLGPPEAWQPFDRLWERDSAATSRPDVAFAGEDARLPVLALVLVERQGEYGGAARHGSVEAALERLVARTPAAWIRIDTRLDVPNPLRTPAEVESLLGRVDAVVTNRLHGLVLALKNGVPALAVDPVAGGAKVLRQAETLGWPIVLTPESATDEALRDALASCLRDEARARARECAARARSVVESVRREFVDAMRES